ncbi:MAG: hypothetical protein ABEJ47_02335, partial [Halorhabdus sp.]
MSDRSSTVRIRIWVRIDLNDAFVSPFFVLASGVQAGLFQLILFGIDLAEPVIDNGPGGNKSGLAGVTRVARRERRERLAASVTTRGNECVRAT